MKLKKLKAEIQEIEEKINGSENIGENIQEQQKEILSEMKKIGIDKLPYSYSSLQRFIDPKTMNVHYNKHYKGYVEKLNKALEKVNGADLDLEEIVKSISRFSKVVRNNAGGAFNHALFWKMLTPKRQKRSGAVLEKIEKDFGSYDEFKKQFIEKSKSNFGSGWCWLVLNNQNKLKIVTTQNQDNPLMNVVKNGGYPLLGLDLWEHAYYLRYQNKRDEYIEKFFLVINWDFVNKLYSSKTEKKLNEGKLVYELLTEDKKSAGCNSVQVKQINRLFSTNPQVKYRFMNTINQIMKEVFSEYWKEKNEYEPGSMSGIYDFGTPGRSVINKLNTNYSSFCILMNDLNSFLKTKNIKPIQFSHDDKTQQITEVDRFNKYLLMLKDRIFNIETSKTFQEILRKLKDTDARGEKREDVTIIDLKKIFKTDNVSKIGGLGSEEDMISGVDAVIELDGKRLTAQIKPFSSIVDFDNDSVMIHGASAPKMYKTDFLVFNNTGKTIVFKNTNTKIIDGNYVFPKSDRIDNN
jgi:superoxide dismutase, Fe-Mn family